MAYDLEPMAPAAGSHKSGRRLVIGDKHKTIWPRRWCPFPFLDSLAYDLEPMAPAAGHQKSGRRPFSGGETGGP
ncbi:hypothetical protein [Niallia taxi]|uniref:hypothetical protein n=1 Tax=Niallia taxi TaxID=2499688 RepID=UPI002E1FDB8C|nr:hypothetical protein [Niallia taxi]